MRIARMSVILALSAALVILLPAAAFGAMTNEYGMTFGGQDTPVTGCMACHDNFYAQTLHGRHVTPGLAVAPPASWSVFSGPGSVAASGGPDANSGTSWFAAGGSYSITGLFWANMFDYEGESRWSEEEPPLMFFSGNTSGSTASPWNRVSGVFQTHTSPFYEYATSTTSLSDSPVSSTCGIVNCHFTGGTMPLSAADATAGRSIPNPAVVSQPTTQTKTQWARYDMFTADDFNTSATVGVAGMGIQCEKCHGTGFDSADLTTRHWNSGTQLSHRLATQTVNAQPVARTTMATLGRSDVCGVCHGLRSAPAVTGAQQYLMGYTPNLLVRNFVSVNATRGANAPYTYRPTDAEFAANPSIYAQYPSGNPRSGGHGGNQYWAWASSGHAVRVQTGRNDPDALPGASATNFNINGATTSVLCLRCHTGEGYLTTKVPQVNDGRTLTSAWDGFTISKTSSGFMGQECVVCHNPHPGSSDAADTVRSADPAGMRSNFGRTTANASMCEDCHNWQIEAMADALPLNEFNPQALPSRVSHAQREILHGAKRGTASVMWEVEDMGEFMPGAKCEDCHMPKTDTGAEYSSHRMMIQMPGEAAEWAATGEDSCTKCHEEAGETIAEAREVMQAKIDEWQTAAIAAAADAKTAIDAAKLRSEYTMGGTGAKELYGRAWLNWNTYTNDGSFGAHNPPYLLAGMEAAKMMADCVGGSFDQTYITSRLSIGNVGAIAGHVDLGTGDSAAGAKVALERWNGSSWVEEGSTVAGTNGNVSFMVSPALGTHTYRLRWDRCSNNNADLYSGQLSMTVAKVASRTTAVPSATSILLGNSFTLRGNVSPNASAQVVTIYFKKSTAASWSTTTRTLNASSDYSRTFAPTSRGTWYFRTNYPGTATVAGSWSVRTSVVVR